MKRVFSQIRSLVGRDLRARRGRTCSCFGAIGRCLTSIAPVVMLAMMVGCSRTPPDLGYFTADFDRALATAKAENKLVMVDLYADWCGWCTKLDTDVFDTAEVRGILTNHFVPVKADIEDGGEGTRLQRRFGTTGLPHIVFVNTDGEKIHEILGFVPADEFAEQLNTLVKTSGQ